MLSELSEEECEEVDTRLCDVCSAEVAKYKCPRCSIMSCSCACCVAHKIESGCNGKRDRTAFVPMQSFAAANLRNGGWNMFLVL